MSDFERILLDYENRRIGLQELRSAALQESELRPDHRQAVVGALTNAYHNGDISANDLAEIMAALRDLRTRLADGEGAAATVVAVNTPPRNAQETVAVSAGAGAATRVVTTPPPRRDEPPKSRTAAIVPGVVLKDRFKLERLLGEGGMGKVFLALDQRKAEAQDRDPYVALKVLSDAFHAHADSWVALQREARNAQRLSHPNIVTVFDFDRDGENVFMSMEYLRGQPLDQYMRSEAADGMSSARAWPIIRGMALALLHAHSHGIVHSDFKPANVFLTENGVVKVLDFGIARAADPDTLTKWDAGQLGALTPPYASREMLEREQPDRRDDIYGLGCVVYQLLTGRHPFQVDKQRVNAIEAESQGLKPVRPKGLGGRQWRALRGTLAFRRDHRTATVKAFLDQFDPKPKPRTWAYVMAAWVLIACVAGGLYYYTRTEPVSLDPTERYLAELLAIPLQGRQRLEADVVRDLLEEGEYYLSSGEAELQAGEYRRGNAELLNGATTAFRPFHAVLTGTTDDDARQMAARGIMRIATSYVTAVNVLVDMQLPEKALWLTCQGLIPQVGFDLPAWHELEALYEQVWADAKLDSYAPPTQGCKTVPEHWGDPLHLRRPR